MVYYGSLHVLGKPDALTNCTLVNYTYSTISVDCYAGFDGGLPQWFTMEVYDAQTQQLRANVTGHLSIFTAENLPPGESFLISIYARNNKGRSENVVLSGETLKLAEKRIEKDLEGMSLLSSIIIISIFIIITSISFAPKLNFRFT